MADPANFYPIRSQYYLWTLGSVHLWTLGSVHLHLGETLLRKFVWSKSSGEKYEQSFSDIDIEKDIKNLLLSVVNNNNVEMKLNELNDIFNKAADRSLKKVNSVYKQSKQKRKKQIFHDTIYFETKRHIRFLARTVNINPFNMYIRA